MKPRKYIEPERDRPLVTRFGTVRFIIQSLNRVIIFTSSLIPIESGRFEGEIAVTRDAPGQKWSALISERWFLESVTPRREQLLLRACERALKNIHASRFKRAEETMLSNAILYHQEKIAAYQAELERLLVIEAELT